jgi:hypothetical protein
MIGQLLSDFMDHFEGSLADTLESERREPIRNHGSNKESQEYEWHIDAEVLDGEIVGRIGGSGQVGTIEGKRDESSRSNSESLTNSSSRITGSIELVGALADFVGEAHHLRNTAGIVGDWTIGVNGETNAECAEHTEGSKSNSEHGEQGKANESGDGE